MYDITDPECATFVDYVNNRDFDFDVQGEVVDGTADPSAAGDLGPEGLDFATVEESPTDDPLVFVGHEISGTTAVFRVVSDDGDDDQREASCAADSPGNGNGNGN